MYSTHSISSTRKFLNFLQVLFVYLTCTIIISYYTCIPFALSPDTCSHLPPSTIELSETSSHFHYFTTGAFGASVLFILIEMSEAAHMGDVWNSQLYCALTISSVAFIGQLSIALKLVRPWMNTFGRVVFVPRLLEWISLGTCLRTRCFID